MQRLSRIIIGHVAADCGTRKLERDLEQSPQSLSSVTTSVAASTVQLTTIEETEETIRNTSVTEPFTLEEKSGIGSEPNNGSGLEGEKEGEGEGERKGEKEECESAPTTPMTPESSVRKRYIPFL